MDSDIDQASTLTRDDLIQLARVDFWVFVELAFPVLHPGESLVFAPYLEVLASLLTSCTKRQKRRVIVNLPPRYMKSDMVSILYTAWRLGIDPTTKFICISYGDDLAHALSARTRKLMLSPFYREIFPGTVLAKKSTDHLVTTEDGYRYATAVGSDITGFGADEIIIDDPLQPDDAVSELAKQKVREWVQTSVLTRFNNPATGVLILVMHRLAPDDLSHTLQASGGYFVLKLPLVAEKQERFEHENRLIMKRSPGEWLNPDRMTADEFEALKAETAPHVFAAQYQQRPTAGGSGMCSIERLRRYDKVPNFELMIHSWDIGATLDGNATVCTKWGLQRETKLGDVLYLTDVIKLKAELPDVRAAIKVQDKLDTPALIIVDGVGVGLGIVQDLHRENYRHVYPYTKATNLSITSKIERFGRTLLHLYDHRVAIPNSAPFLDDFLYEVAAFPNGAEDDQVDSMSQVFANFDRTLMLARQKHRPADL
jgi:predicted phage terminase large subunit-like protein